MSVISTASSPPQRDSKARVLPTVAHVPFRTPPAWKRTFDIVGSLALLVVLAPLLIFLAVYIKCVSRGPVLFRQERIGGGAKRFIINKFRTMHAAQVGDSHRDYVASLIHSESPAMKPEYKSRLILGGSTLRSLSLDELPQLFNVLLGNMSLIGPRPEVLRLEDYEAWQLRRFEVLPGISGLWQVSGKNRLTFNQMIRLDIQYVDGLTPALDLKIALKTLEVVVLRRNH
jgi:lipopolysaccharide/colanic/teichoic acid biosynthesis glycosyltransferase